MSIVLQNLEKHYGNYQALAPATLKIQRGEMLALLGPSGSGKTTLLRLIAGLETPDAGSIHINDQDVTRTPVKDRNIGFVFQHYALFKHMSVLDNVAFGLSVLPRAKRPNKSAQRAKAQQLLDMVQLGHLANRRPASLSGGQQQRVALARALAIDPSVVLFDEPFGALDVKVRRDLRLWLKNLQRNLHFTGVFVTHDQEEALDLADRITVMYEGNILQTADADTLYRHPSNASVFRFMSDTHEWPVTVKNQILDLGSATAYVKADIPIPHGEGTLAIRNQELALSDHPVGGLQMPVIVTDLANLGTQYRLSLTTIGFGQHDTLSILLPVQSLPTLPILNQRYYLAPKQAYFLGEDGSVTALIHNFDNMRTLLK